MQDYRKLLVWQKAHELTLAVYHTSMAFPQAEQYGLTSQIRRAAVSIPSTIAEGCGRGSDAELIRFLQVASGSAAELEYQLLLACDLGYCPPDDYELLAEGTAEVRRMLAGLIKRLKSIQ